MCWCLSILESKRKGNSITKIMGTLNYIGNVTVINVDNNINNSSIYNLNYQ